MASQTRTTTDHEEIRRWAEDHDGHPARVRETGSGSAGGVLRIDFPGGVGDDQLEIIDWEEWFETFDDNGLVMLYQEDEAPGEGTNFFKLVRR